MEGGNSYVGQQMQRRRKGVVAAEGVSVLRRREVTGRAGVHHAMADYKTGGGCNSGPTTFALLPLPLNCPNVIDQADARGTVHGGGTQTGGKRRWRSHRPNFKDSSRSAGSVLIPDFRYATQLQRARTQSTEKTRTYMYMHTE